MVFIEMPPQMEGEEESLGLKADRTVKVSLAALGSMQGSIARPQISCLKYQSRLNF